MKYDDVKNSPVEQLAISIACKNSLKLRKSLPSVSKILKMWLTKFSAFPAKILTSKWMKERKVKPCG